MRLRETGEFGLIERLAAVLGRGSARADGLAIGIGDDAAVWVQDRAAIVATTDMLIEGVHFDLALTSWRDLGWKALAVNLSDIAAMGATPKWALVGLGLRPDIRVEDVEALYEGMKSLADSAGCTVVGGDTVAAPREAVISVTALGAVPADEQETLLRRSGGRAGDVVAVTGVLGASAAGLFALQHPDSAPAKARERLAREHYRPQPQLAAGALLRAVGVRCAMDVSDGLLADLEKLCAASRVGAQVAAERLPLHAEAVAAYPAQALGWAASGGEDYQLLFCAPPPVMERALGALREHGIRGTEIGQLVDGAGARLIDRNGTDVRLASGGWDHFAGGADA